MSSKGKEKGSGFERAMCGRLSLWVSNHKREDAFWRSAMSGGRATVHINSAKTSRFDAHAGDLTATHESGHLLLRMFIVECKFWMRLYLDELIYEMKPVIMVEWNKLKAQALTQHRLPMMVAKQNRRPEMVLLTSEGLRIIRRGCPKPEELIVRATFPREDIHIVSLNNMIVDCEFDRIRKRFKTAPVRVEGGGVRDGYREVAEELCD